MRTTRWVSRVALSTVLAVGVLVGVAPTDDTGTIENHEAAAAIARADDEASMGETATSSAKRLVNVYWTWTIPTHPTHDERLGAGGREVAAMTPATGAMQKLLAGPNAVEQGIGMSTAIPSGTELLGINIVSDVATVDLTSEFEGPGSSHTDLARVTQVVFTLTQFGNVDRVRFNIDGVPRDLVTSHGIVVGDGLERDELPYFRPLIMVEHPYPGARVVDPLVVRGESNTFEATVEYILTARGGDGLIIAEGFTTATSGSGTWGTYEFSIDLDALADYEPGPGAIIVYETSPLDGSQMSVVEYPIVLPPRCRGRVASMLGTADDDVIVGTSGSDSIVTGRGDDIVHAGAGNDAVCLGAGNDTAYGQRGDDRINGGTGADTLVGGRGADVMRGGDGRDTLLGRQGTDVLRGDDGRDVINGGAGADIVRGNAGNDLLHGQTGNDTLNGGRHADHLDGGRNTDLCNGWTGVDTASRCETLIRIP